MTHADIAQAIVDNKPWAYYELAQLELEDQCRVMETAAKRDYRIVSDNNPNAAHFALWCVRCAPTLIRLMDNPER